MYRRLVLLVAAAVLSSVVPAAAQNPVLDQMYGTGVHAYFSRQYTDAYNDLTSAIDAGSVDPRVYYFRGLAFLNLGRPEEAEAHRGAEELARTGGWCPGEFRPLDD